MPSWRGVSFRKSRGTTLPLLEGYMKQIFYLRSRNWQQNRIIHDGGGGGDDDDDDDILVCVCVFRVVLQALMAMDQ
jgi:hypothetical protein